MARFFSVEDVKARDIMSTDMVSAEPTEPLSELLGRMKAQNVYELPVIDNGYLVGLVSYDVLIKRRQFPLSSEARSVMVSPPTVSEDDGISRIAEALLSSDLRAVPVARRQKVLGMVSRGDILRSLVDVRELSGVKVDDLMTPSPTTVEEGESIEKARQVMKSLDQRSVPVVDDLGKLTGVIGARDIVNLMEGQKEKRGRRIPGDRVDLDIKVGSVMSSPVISIAPEATLAEALKLMAGKNVSTVVVAREDRPLGVVTQTDVLAFLTSLREREGLYVNITGLEDEDPDTYDALYSVIEKAMKRVASISSPQVLTMHISRHNREGDVSKHSIHVRLNTRKGLYIASTFGWDLFSATDDAMRKLEKQIRRDVDRIKEKPHRKGIVD